METTQAAAATEATRQRAPGLNYPDRIKLIRLLASAAIELNAARKITNWAGCGDATLDEHTRTACRATLDALRRLLLDEARTVSRDDMIMLDPTIRRALAQRDL